MQTTTREVYYGAYVYDIRDNIVHEVSEMLREWKGAKWMDKYIIAPDRFNTGYEEKYKDWLKDNILSISSPIPRNYLSIEYKDAKVVIKVKEVKCEA